MCYWASQGPPHHHRLQCLKKRQHSYKNTIKLSLEKILETTQPKVWRQKSHLPKQLQKLVNLPAERGPFNRASYFIKEFQIGGKNSGRTTTVNTFCSERKELSHSNSQISLPVKINMEELTQAHPVLKHYFQTKKSEMCPSRQDKEISPSFSSRALDFSRRLPNSSFNWTSTGEVSKSTKSKSGTTKTSRSGNEGNAGKELHFKSLSLKRAILSSLFLINKKDVWRELTSHKFEESESVQSLQKLQDGIFALSEICVAKRGLHVQNRPEGYTSAFLYTKIHEN